MEGKLHKSVYGINKLLKKDKRELEFLAKEENHLHKDYYESKHLNDFLIKHFMLDFTALNSA